jgi:hypothetical protein
MMKQSKKGVGEILIPDVQQSGSSRDLNTKLVDCVYVYNWCREERENNNHLAILNNNNNNNQIAVGIISRDRLGGGPSPPFLFDSSSSSSSWAHFHESQVVAGQSSGSGTRRPNLSRVTLSQV